MTLPMARDLSQLGIRVVSIALDLFLNPLLETARGTGQLKGTGSISIAFAHLRNMQRWCVTSLITTC